MRRYGTPGADPDYFKKRIVYYTFVSEKTCDYMIYNNWNN